MKKIALGFVALVALFGILNCVVLEPAFAFKEEAAHSEENDSDCCYTHCTTCHLWLLSVFPVSSHSISSSRFIPVSAVFHHDAPPGSIFHPPLAL